MSTTTNGLALKLSLNGLQQVEAGLRSLTRNLTTVQTAVVAIAGGALAFSGLSKISESVNKVIQLGGELSNLKARSSAAIRDILALREALQDTGGDASEAGRIIRLMQQTISDAATQGGNAERAFSRLNLSITDLMQMRTSDQIRAIGDALMKVQNPAERTALAMEIFGRAGDSMIALFSDGDAVGSLTKGAGLFGEVMSRNAKVLDDIGDRFTRLSESGLRFFAGVLDQLPLDRIETTLKKFIDDFDFTALGQKVGGFINVAIDQWNAGRFDQFLALTIDAGLELAKEHWQRFTGYVKADLNNQLSRALMDAAVTLVVRVLQAVVKAVSATIDLLAVYALTFFGWFGDQVRWIVETIGAGLRDTFTTVINFLAERLEKLVNGFFGALHKGMSFLGIAGDFKPAEFGRIQQQFSNVAKPASMSTWQERTEAALTDKGNVVVDQLEKIVTATRQLLGIQTDTVEGVKAETAAREKLKALIDAQLASREQSAAVPAEDPVKVAAMVNVKRFIAEQEAQSRRTILALDTQIAAIENDFALTSAEKFTQRRALLIQEKAELQTIVALIREWADMPGLSPEERTSVLSKADSFQAQSDGVDTKLGGMGPDPSSMMQQTKAMLTEMQDQVGTVAQSIARMFKTIIGGAIDSIAGAIGGLIRGTMTWGQALQGIGVGIVNSIIDAFARMAAEWIVTHVIMEGIAWAFAGVQTAIAWFVSGNQIAAESAKTPVLSINAVLASISSYGAAGWIGAIAMVAAIGVGLAAISGAFADGGRPPVGRPALVGERGPELFVPDTAGTIIPNHLMEDYLTQPAAGSGQQRKVSLHMHMDRESLQSSILNSDAMEDRIIDVLSRRRHELSV